jgi:predicted metal-dependent hydrolase
VWWQGKEVPLRVEAHGDQEWISVGPLRFPAKPDQSDLRPMVEEQMRVHAAKVLPPRTMEKATEFDLEPRSVTVRNQSTRWGSCSHAGRLSLNWRLVQLPPAVCDYVIIHELMHLKELNHSRRFWELVAKACPDYKAHETWLKTNAVKLGM